MAQNSSVASDILSRKDIAVIPPVFTSSQNITLNQTSISIARIPAARDCVARYECMDNDSNLPLCRGESSTHI